MRWRSAGIVTAKNTRGVGNRLVQRETADEVYGYRCNGHGDIIALTDASGRVVEDYAYDPYGNAVEDSAEEVADGYTWSAEAETARADNPFRYCGEYYDAETGFYYLRARYYDPELGRFTQEDTYRGKTTDPLSLNLYTYCGNNPIIFTDPNGHELVLAIVAVSALAVVAVATVADPNFQKACYKAGEQIKEGLGKLVDSAKNAIYQAKTSKSKPGPVGKPNLKKQGREANYKARQDPKWVNRGNKDINRPMNNHHPGNHQRDSKS